MTETEHDLLDASREIGGILEMAGWATDRLARRIEAYGKWVGALTIDELRTLLRTMPERLEEKRMTKNTQLHFRLSLDDVGGSLTYSTEEPSIQEALSQDVKVLMIQYLARMQFPSPKTKVLEEACVEILSEDTRAYIETLEDLLQECSDETEDDDLSARIEKVLR